jgi:hypothetical protein
MINTNCSTGEQLISQKLHFPAYLVSWWAMGIVAINGLCVERTRRASEQGT